MGATYDLATDKGFCFCGELLGYLRFFVLAWGRFLYAKGVFGVGKFGGTGLFFGTTCAYLFWGVYGGYETGVFIFGVDKGVGNSWGDARGVVFV